MSVDEKDERDEEERGRESRVGEEEHPRQLLSGGVRARDCLISLVI